MIDIKKEEIVKVEEILDDFIASKEERKKEKLLMFIAGMSVGEIARELGETSRQAINEQITRAIERVHRRNPEIQELLYKVSQEKYINIKRIFPRHCKIIQKLLKEFYGKNTTECFVREENRRNSPKTAKEMLSKIGLPFYIQIYGYKNAFYDREGYLVARDGEKSKGWVIYTEKEEGNTILEVLARKSSSVLHTLCDWKKKDKTRTIEEIYEEINNKAGWYWEEKGVPTIQSLSLYIARKRSDFEKKEKIFEYKRDEGTASKYVLKEKKVD